MRLLIGGIGGAAPLSRVRNAVPPAAYLVLYGVPRSMTRGGSPTWRRVVWIVLFVGFLLCTQLAPLLIGFVEASFGTAGLVGLFSFGGLAGLALVGVLIFMIATGRRERDGVERADRDAPGRRACRAAARAEDPSQADGESGLAPWGAADTVEITRISPVWHRLRIGVGAMGRVHQVTFEAGIRCPEQWAPLVQHELQTRLAEAPRPDAPPAGPVGSNDS